MMRAETKIGGKTMEEWRAFAVECGWDDALEWSDEETADFAQREEDAEAEMLMDEWKQAKDAGEEKILVNKTVAERMAGMLIGSLRYYACDDCDDEDLREKIGAIADRIEDGTATEEEWLEAISQIDMSDPF